MSRRRFTVYLAEPFSKCVDRLVDAGFYGDYQDVFRTALRSLFKDHGLEGFGRYVEEEGRSPNHVREDEPNYLHGNKGRNYIPYRSRRAP